LGKLCTSKDGQGAWPLDRGAGRGEPLHRKSEWQMKLHRLGLELGNMAQRWAKLSAIVLFSFFNWVFLDEGVCLISSVLDSHWANSGILPQIWQL